MAGKSGSSSSLTQGSLRPRARPVGQGRVVARSGSRTSSVARSVKGGQKKRETFSDPPDLAVIRERGRDLASAKREEIARRHPQGILVAFHLPTGKYVTAQDQRTLIEKYEAKFGDDWGWFARF